MNSQNPEEQNRIEETEQDNRIGEGSEDQTTSLIVTGQHYPIYTDEQIFGTNQVQRIVAQPSYSELASIQETSQVQMHGQRSTSTESQRERHRLDNNVILSFPDNQSNVRPMNSEQVFGQMDRVSARHDANTIFDQLTFNPPNYGRQSERGDRMDQEDMREHNLTVYESIDHAGHRQADEQSEEAQQRSTNSPREADILSRIQTENQEPRGLRRQEREIQIQTRRGQDQDTASVMREMRLIGREAISQMESETAQEREILQQEIQQLRRVQSQLRDDSQEITNQDSRTLQAAQAYINELEAENAYYRRNRESRALRNPIAEELPEQEDDSDFQNVRQLRQLPQSLINQPSPRRNFSPERRHEPEEKAESILDYIHLIPKEFTEELLDKRFDNTLSVSILLSQGPLTLLIFNRCLDISHRYQEFRDIRLYPMTTATREELAFHQSKKLASFIFFTWQMAQKDLMHQWRIQKLFLQVIPSAKELKTALKQTLKLQDETVIHRELLMWKTICEILEFAELKKRDSKQLQQNIYPCLRKIISCGGDKLISQTKKMVKGCLALDNSKFIIQGRSVDECLSLIEEKQMQLRAVTASSNLKKSQASSQVIESTKADVYSTNKIKKESSAALDLSCNSPLKITKPSLSISKVSKKQDKEQAKPNKISQAHTKHQISKFKRHSDLSSQFLH